jgi:hypothetical protein
MKLAEQVKQNIHTQATNLKYIFTGKGTEQLWGNPVEQKLATK